MSYRLAGYRNAYLQVLDRVCMIQIIQFHIDIFLISWISFKKKKKKKVKTGAK